MSERPRMARHTGWGIMVAMTAVPMCLVSGTMTLGIGIMLIALFPTSVFFRPRDLRKCFLNRDANGWRYQPGKIVLGQKGWQRFLPGILSENQSRSTRNRSEENTTELQ